MNKRREKRDVCEDFKKDPMHHKTVLLDSMGSYIISQLLNMNSVNRWRMMRHRLMMQCMAVCVPINFNHESNESNESSQVGMRDKSPH